MKLHPLTQEEKQIIIGKKKEAPFSGKYDQHFQPGTYLCKQCHTPLYQSTSKFNAHCGWPSFDREIPGTVTRTPDPDGRRTEVTCTACKAHLGHVFEGEGQTITNTRHCVNSLSLTFQPQTS